MSMVDTVKRPLYFQDKLLPSMAFFLEVLASGRLIKNIPEKLSEFFWRFSVCVGVVKKEKSTTIKGFTNELLLLMDENIESIINSIPDSLDLKLINLKPQEIFGQWKECISIILAECDKAEVCDWYADAHPSDPGWPGTIDYVKKLQGRGITIKPNNTLVRTARDEAFRS